jgi:hypothetical protein
VADHFGVDAETAGIGQHFQESGQPFIGAVASLGVVAGALFGVLAFFNHALEEVLPPRVHANGAA